MAAVGLLASTAVYAQSTDPTSPPRRINVDDFLVSRTTGYPEIDLGGITIGEPGQGQLRHVRHWMWPHYRLNYAISVTSGDYVGAVKVHFARTSRQVVPPTSLYPGGDLEGMGGTIEYISSGLLKFTERDGMEIIFDESLVDYSANRTYFTDIYQTPMALAKQIIYPDGETIELHYKTVTYGSGTSSETDFTRLQSVTSNRGYQIKYEYQTGSAPSAFSTYDPFFIPFYNLTAVRLINNAIEYCSPTADTCGALANDWPTVSYTRSISGNINVDTETDPVGGATRITFESAPLNNGTRRRATKIKFPGSAVDNIQYFYGEFPVVGFGYEQVTSVQYGGNTWTYFKDVSSPSASQIITTITDPLGGETKATTNLDDQMLAQDVDELDRVTSRQTDFVGRLVAIQYDEGNRVEYVLDDRGNRTQTILKSKPTATLPDITTSASFPATCSSPAKCNKPEWVQDANGNRTDYDYDPAHGGVLYEMGPAPVSNGARPLKLVTWVQKYAWIRNSGGSLVQASSPIWLMATETQCQTASGSSPNPVCDNAAPKILTTYQYGANGSAQSLLLKGVAVSSDGTVLRTCYGYDIFGRKISETAPNANLSSCP